MRYKKEAYARITVLLVSALILLVSVFPARAEELSWSQVHDLWTLRTHYFDVSVEYDPSLNPEIARLIPVLDSIAQDLRTGLGHTDELRVSVRLMREESPMGYSAISSIGYVKLFSATNSSASSLASLISYGYCSNILYAKPLPPNGYDWFFRVVTRYYSEKHMVLLQDPAETAPGFRARLSWPLEIDGKPYRCSWKTIVTDHERWLNTGDPRYKQVRPLIDAIGSFIAEKYGEAAFAQLVKEYQNGTKTPWEIKRVFGNSEKQLREEFYLWVDQQMSANP